jgi:hypothetical protein
MSHIIIGALAMAVLLLLVNHTRKHGKTVRWWQWLLTILGILYTIFVLELVGAFLDEGAPRAALVTGLTTGFVVVIWGVLLGRFVFAGKNTSNR